MPQKTQIVPKFQHPHVETYINDYTQYRDEEVTAVDNNSQFIAVFRSSCGIDNVLVKKTSLSDFTKTFGTSNYEKYGQPLMMPIGILSSGNASVRCMRVMPDDAFAANSVLNLLYKKDGNKMIIKFQSTYFDVEDFTEPTTGVMDTDAFKTQKAFKKQLRLYAAALAKTGENQVDDQGFNSIPIATFRMNGRGFYGNEYRWRIVPNLTYEKDYGIKMYTFEVINSAGGIEKVASYVGSLVTSEKYSDSLTLINDILDEEDMGDIIMDIQVFEENVEFVYDIFKDFVESLPEADRDKHGIPELDEFDPLFGLVVGTSEANSNIQVIGAMVNGEGTSYSTEDDISVDSGQGTALDGGSDGAFSEGSTITVEEEDANGNIVTNEYGGQRAIDEAAKEAYIKAFSGELDKTIISTRRTPCVALLDANYPPEVKQVMAELVNTRESMLLYLDGGIEVTDSNIKSVIRDLEDFNTRNISKSIQHYTTKDPTTKKRCEVTMTYFIAQKLAEHIHNEGSWIPFVKSRARLSGHIKNTVEPCIDDVDSELKELLHENRINYFECLEENVYERATQNTAQMINSDLLEENNMFTLYEIKRIIEADCWDSLYDFTSAERRADFTEFEKAKFAGWAGSRFDTIDIKFDANDWEAERSIIHCYVSVQFRNLMKRAIIEIDVNKRNFTA